MYGHNAPSAPPYNQQGAPAPRDTSYGAPRYGAPPPQGPHYGSSNYPHSNAYPHGGLPQMTPPCPPGVSQQVFHWFKAVDADQSGQITCVELQQALTNGNWTNFNPETCRLMIGMFDTNGSSGKPKNGKIDLQEFAALWTYIENWKKCFDRFDGDRSGTINGYELEKAFRDFGYTLSQKFVSLCLRVFDRKSTSTINFDDFIQCSVTLKCLTDEFRRKDVQQKGVITVGYEEFLNMALNNSVV